MTNDRRPEPRERLALRQITSAEGMPLSWRSGAEDTRLVQELRAADPIALQECRDVVGILFTGSPSPPSGSLDKQRVDAALTIILARLPDFTGQQCRLLTWMFATVFSSSRRVTPSLEQLDGVDTSQITECATRDQLRHILTKAADIAHRTPQTPDRLTDVLDTLPLGDAAQMILGSSEEELEQTRDRLQAHIFPQAGATDPVRAIRPFPTDRDGGQR